MENKKISASRILLAFCMILTFFSVVIAEEAENGVGNQVVEENEGYFDYWSEPKELMSSEEFRSYYNFETSDLGRAELIRVRKVAEFNGGANWISIMSVNGQIVFCLDPTVTAGIGMEYNKSYDWDNLSWDTQLRIWEVVRFGYQQYGSDDYYIASQILIWRALGHWITPNVNVDSQINQIEVNINNFGTPPSFNNQTLDLEYQIGKTITDTNGVLNKYSVNCPNGISCSKDGNNLTLTINNLNYDKNGKIDISSPGTNDPSWLGVAYARPNSQSVLSITFADPSARFKLNVKMSTGDLHIIKIDEYGLMGGSGHKFEVAFDEEFTDVIGIYTTNNEGKIEIKDTLPAGTYYIREVETVNGYVLNPEIFEVIITNNQVSSITIVNNLREVELEVFKIDLEENELLLNGAKFDVTDITEAFEKQKVDEDGNLVWADEEETEAIMERVGATYEYSVTTGNQYLRFYTEDNHTNPLIRELIEFSLSENFEEEEIIIAETDEAGLINISELSIDSDVVYYRTQYSQELRVLEILEKQELEGYANLPLKWGRIYEVCEVGLPDGYEFVDEPCRVIKMDLDEGITFKTETVENQLRRITVKLIKRDSIYPILLDGAHFKVYDTYYQTDEKEKGEYLGKYITGALFIYDFDEVEEQVKDKDGNVIMGENGQPIMSSEEVPNARAIYHIYDEESKNLIDKGEEVIPSYTFATDEYGEIIEYLPEGTYYSRRDGEEEFKLHHISKGTIYLPDLKYGHNYLVCEIKAPKGYYLPQDYCEILQPITEYGIDIMDNYRVNDMIIIPNDFVIPDTSVER